MPPALEELAWLLGNWSFGPSRDGVHFPATLPGPYNETLSIGVGDPVLATPVFTFTFPISASFHLPGLRAVMSRSRVVSAEAESEELTTTGLLSIPMEGQATLITASPDGTVLVEEGEVGVRRVSLSPTYRTPSQLLLPTQVRSSPLLICVTFE